MNSATTSARTRGGRYLFDLVHPANSLLFYHTIDTLKRRGAEVLVVSRHKDVLIPLLGGLGISHRPISRAGSNRIELAAELIGRDFRLWQIARRFRPDVMTGFGGVAISHVGKLTGIPSVSFYDTEHATLQIRLAVPFIDEWHVPEGWDGLVAPGRTDRFRGGKQFAYLHPDRFVPLEDQALAAGWDPHRDNFLLRTVSWTANHDRGRSGIPDSQLRTLVEEMRTRGKLHISAEGELPPELEQHRFRGSATQLHHLLARCRLHVGESVTVASEAVMLGVPVLLQNGKEHCYITEQQDAGLIHRFWPTDEAVDALEKALAEDQSEFRRRSKRFVAQYPDMNSYVLDTLVRVAEHGPSRGRE